jgi:hypothetical protein
VDHQSEDTHLGGTAVVQLNGPLFQLFLIGKGIPSKVNEVVAEVTGEFSSDAVSHDGNLQESNESKDLCDTGGRDGREGIKSAGNVCEGSSIVGDQSRKTDTGLGGEVSSDGKHANTTVLDLNEAEAIESGLVSVGNKAKRIPETERLLNTDFVFESLQRSGGGSLLSRSEGSGRGKKRGKDSELHCGIFKWMIRKVLSEEMNADGSEWQERTDS